MDNWISVKERMPSTTTAVLVWCPDRRNKYTACWKGGEWNHFGGIYAMTQEVSHWQPTPAPPPDPPTDTEIIESAIINTIKKMGGLPRWGKDLRPFAKTLTEEIIRERKEPKSA